MLGFSRWQIFKTSAAAVLVVGTISLLLIYFIPAPPSTVTMGTAYKGTTFEYFGQRYRDIFARSHVELKLRETEGAMDNIELLKNPKLLQRLERLHRHRSGTVPTAIVLEPVVLNDRVTLAWSPLGAL